MFTISITEKGGPKQLVECTKSVVTLGRLQGNDIVLPLGNVSKRHAQIQLANNTFTVTDIGSTNGTYVNGRKITGPTVFNPGDKMYVGEFIVSVAPSISDEPSSPGIPVLTSERPSIPPPVPKSRKSVPPPPPSSHMIDDNEDTLTSIDESKLPEIQSTFKKLLKRPDIATTQNGANHPQPISAPVEQLIDFVAIEERKIDRANLPGVIDPAVAARVRHILKHMISTLDAENKISDGYTSGSLFMDAFLSIVDVGPLAEFFRDAKVREVWVNDRETILVARDDGFQRHPKGFSTDSLLANALHCLTAGIYNVSTKGEPSPLTDGHFRLENGDLVVWRSSGIDTSASAIIYRASDGTVVHPDADVLIRTVLDRGASIAIAGSHPLHRLQLMEQLAAERDTERMLCLEDRPLLRRQSSNHVHFDGCTSAGDVRPLERLLVDAGSFQGERMLLRASSWHDVPAIFHLAAQGTPMIADIPLGSTGDMEICLNTGLAGCGATGNNAKIFGQTFRLLIICSEGQSPGHVEKILQSENREDGSLKLAVVFESNM